jgi:hypothetical protein
MYELIGVSSVGFQVKNVTKYVHTRLYIVELDVSRVTEEEIACEVKKNHLDE